MKMRTIKNPPWEWNHDEWVCCNPECEACKRFNDTIKKEKKMSKKNATENKYGVKLTQKKVERIRYLSQLEDVNGKWAWTITALATKFGVSRRQIVRVITHECW